MSKPFEQLGPETGIPQFDRAEFGPESSEGPTCRECRRPLEDEYFDVSGNVVCPSCQAKWGRIRSRMSRAFKALLLGSVAATLGAAIYRMILFGTGWNFALVAIVVGYMVGGAVRTGSRDRGGRFYQLLAVFLTYSALVGMFVPDIWNGIAAAQKTRKAEVRLLSVAGGAAIEAAVPRTDIKPRPRGAREEPSLLLLLYLLGMMFLYLLLFVGILYSIPLSMGLHSPITLFIFGIGLWEAWRMNRPSEVVVTGPYRVRR